MKNILYVILNDHGNSMKIIIYYLYLYYLLLFILFIIDLISLYKIKLFRVIFTEVLQDSIRDITVVEPEWLYELAADYYEFGTVHLM